MKTGTYSPRGHWLTTPGKHQFGEVARAYLKSKKLGGLKPHQSMRSVAKKDFGLTEVQYAQVMSLAHNFMRSIGIPDIKDELKSPCHRRHPHQDKIR